VNAGLAGLKLFISYRRYGISPVPEGIRLSI